MNDLERLESRAKDNNGVSSEKQLVSVLPTYSAYEQHPIVGRADECQQVGAKDAIVTCTRVKKEKGPNQTGINN